MRLLNKIAYALCAVALLSSCSEDDDYSRGEAPLDGYENVSLPGTINLEIEPSEPTTYTVEVSRVNTEGDAVMPIEITENTDSVFVVEPVEFKDGESKALMTINFPNAIEGISYRLQLKVTDKNFTSPYDQANFLDLTVTRVKWNPIGFLTDAAGDIYCQYYDDFFTGLYGITGDLTTRVQVQERDDKPGYYRLVDPYVTYAQAFGVAYTDNGGSPRYMYIDATDPNKVYMPSLFDTGMALNAEYGNILIWDMAGYYLAKGDAATAANYYGKLENGKITFPKGALLVGEAADPQGGLYQANNTGNGAFYLQIEESQSQEQYVADPKFDFDWTALFNAGQYTSEILQYSGTATVYKGTCNTKKDGCDTIFANTYGDLYKVENPYGTGADIYFTVKNGVVGVPGVNYAAQATGISVFGKNVYAKINSDGSSFADKLINLNVTYVDESGTIEYGTGTDVISNITYSAWGQGLFTYNAFYGGSDVLQIEKQDGADVYKMKNWGEGVDILFKWNKETNELTIDPQSIGIIQGYNVGIMDLVTSGLADVAVQGGYVKDPRSYYDPTNNTFYFTTIYVDLSSSQVFAYEDGSPMIGDKETLEVVSGGSSKMRAKALNNAKVVTKAFKSAGVHKSSMKAKGFGLVGKKVSKTTTMQRKNNLQRFNLK